MSKIRLPAKRLVKCKACGGAGHTHPQPPFDRPHADGYEYVCMECNGDKNKWIDSEIDLEILANMIKDLIKKDIEELIIKELKKYEKR